MLYMYKNWKENFHWWYLAEWLERLAANAEVATVLGSIPASSDTVKSDESDEAVPNKVLQKIKLQK